MTRRHNLDISYAVAARRPSDKLDVELFSMVLCFSGAIDFLHPKISEHHLRVAYVASCLAEELGLGQDDIDDVLMQVPCTMWRPCRRSCRRTATASSASVLPRLPLMR